MEHPLASSAYLFDDKRHKEESLTTMPDKRESEWEEVCIINTRSNLLSGVSSCYLSR